MLDSRIIQALKINVSCHNPHVNFEKCFKLFERALKKLTTTTKILVETIYLEKN